MYTIYEGTRGKLALTTSRSLEISSLTLNVTNSAGSSQLIPLKKCSNAFTCDYNFTFGSYHYRIQGVDTNKIPFTYDIDRSAVIVPPPSNTYSFHTLNSTKLTILYSDHFNMKFELRSYDRIGTTNFTLSVNAEGFVTTLDSTNVELKPMQAKNVTLTGFVGTGSIGTSTLSVAASNGCVTLTVSREITVNSLVNHVDKSCIHQPIVTLVLIMAIQWNLSITVTLGTMLSGCYAEVACL